MIGGFEAKPIEVLLSEVLGWRTLDFCSIDCGLPAVSVLSDNQVMILGSGNTPEVKIWILDIGAEKMERVLSRSTYMIRSLTPSVRIGKDKFVTLVVEYVKERYSDFEHRAKLLTYERGPGDKTYNFSTEHDLGLIICR